MFVIASCDRQPRCGARVEQRDRRPLAERHRLARVGVEAGQRERAVGDRNLKAADHRIAAAQSADGAIADRDEERLVGDGGQAQHAGKRVDHQHALERERKLARLGGLGAAVHPRRLAEHQLEWNVDGVVRAVGQHQIAVARRGAEPAHGARSRAHSAAKSATRLRRSRARSALAPRCTTTPAATDRARPSGSRAGPTARRGRHRARARASRSTGHLRRRRGSTGWGYPRPAPSSDRSPPGSAARSRRCRAGRSRSRDPRRDAPCASELAAPPPSPIRTQARRARRARRLPESAPSRRRRDGPRRCRRRASPACDSRT